MSKVYTYKFPYLAQYTSIKAGMPVSLDEEGNIWPGAGFTLYRDSSYKEVTDEMKHVKVRRLDFDHVFVVYDGYATIFQANCHGETYQGNTVELPMEGTERFRVRELVHLSGYRYIIVGRTTLLPVIVQRKDNTFKLNVGTPLEMNIDEDRFPHVDNLDDDTFAMVYENGFFLYTNYGSWVDGDKPSLVLKAQAKLVHRRLDFHGIAGMDSNHWVVAATGKVHNSTSPYTSTRAWLVTLKDGAMTVSEHIYVPWSMTCGWFGMDNIGRDHVIIAYSDLFDNGVRAVLLSFDRQKESISFGAQAVMQKGGSIVDFEQIDVTVLNNRQFVVTYEDGVAHGLMMVMGSRTDSNDILATSPTFVVGRPGRGEHLDYFHFDVAELGKEHFVIIEPRKVNGRFSTRIDLADSYPRLLGIAKANGKKGVAEIQLGGILTVSSKKKLTPGRAIYANSKGDLIESLPYGYASRNFGVFYVVDKETNTIVDNRNLIGVAVSKNKIRMRLQ